MKRASILIRILALALPLALVACGSDDGGDGGTGPNPGGTEDSITFLVFTQEGSEDVFRWKGNAEGPAADSPEPTPHPYVGYGRSFRVEWIITSAEGAIVGYRYRASQLGTAPFLPVDADGNPVWGSTTSFTFNNDIPASALEGEDCASGPDCPDRLRFDSGLHRIEVIALDTAGRETAVADGTLPFDVNYPPETVLTVADPPACDDDMLFPRYSFQPADGDPILCSFAPGDTIPSGSVVTIQIDGFDRLSTHVSTDSFCCDTRLDDTSPEVQFQGRIEYVGVLDNDLPDSIGVPGPGYGPLGETRDLQFRVGPFDYVFYGRASDEHRRNDPTPATLHFVAGFSPWITDVSPHDGDHIVLNPDYGPEWTVKGWNDVAYEAVATTWYWLSNVRQWSAERPGTGVEFQTVDGTLFRLPLQFHGAMDPREPRPAGPDEQRYAGSIVSWAYAFYSENDPDNSISQGGGQDDLFVQRYADSPQPNEWILTGEDAVQIFVPSTFWEYPEYYDPDGECPVESWCDIGALLWRELGDTTLEVRGKTTPGEPLSWCQPKPTPAGSEECGLSHDLGRYGRRSAKVGRHFSLRLGFADESGTLIDEWPPPGPVPARAGFDR